MPAPSSSKNLDRNILELHRSQRFLWPIKPLWPAVSAHFSEAHYCCPPLWPYSKSSGNRRKK